MKSILPIGRRVPLGALSAGMALAVCLPTVAGETPAPTLALAAAGGFEAPPARLSLPLEIVMVTASRGGSLLRETPASITRRDHHDIEAKKPTFIGEVLNSVPGVYMTDLGNEQHSMSIRQPLSYSALYLYMQDGIPIRPLGLFNHNALYEINLAGVGAVEVIRGPAASLYGSNSVGGTINFLTRSPSETAGGHFGIQHSDQDLRRLDVSFSGRTDGSGPDLGVVLAAYGSRRDNGWQDHNSAEKDAVTARIDWAINDSTELVTVLSHNQLRTDMPGSLNADDYRRQPEFSYHRFTYRDVEASRVSFALEGNWLDAGPSAITVYGRDNRTEQLPSYLVFDAPANPAIASGRWNDSSFTSLGLDLRQQFHFDWLDTRLVVGLNGEYTRSDYREDQLAIDRDPASGQYLGYRFDSNRRDYQTDLDNRAGYAQLELSPLANTRLVLGLRHDRIEYDYRNRKLPGPISGAADELRTFSQTSPRIGLSWSPLPNHTFFTSWAEGFTPPEVSALYGRLDVPDLAESLFTNVELGWRGELDSLPLAVDITLYQMEGRDEVVNYSEMPGQSEPRNAGATRHRGIEFGVEWTPSAHWQVAAAGAYSRHTFDEYRVSPTLDYSNRDMPAAPEWLGTLEVRWHPAALANLTLSLEGVYLDEYWMNNANTVRYDGHALLNLRASYRTGPWRLWFKAQNLSDRHYAEVAASSFSGIGTHLPNRQDTFTPGAPRTLTLGLEYRWGEE